MNVAPDLSGDLPRARDRTTRSWLGGLLEYHPVALASDLAEAWFRALRDNARWTRPKVRLFGREIDSPRLAAWYGDPGARYTYSGLANEPMPWIEPLPEARRLAERLAGASFNGVLLNFYRDGGDSMGWHSDDEPELDPRAPVVSLSLGAARRFRLRHRRLAERRLELELAPGSLLIMHPPLQREWRHAVPRQAGAGVRINLTFRRIR